MGGRAVLRGSVVRRIQDTGKYGHQRYRFAPDKGHTMMRALRKMETSTRKP
jgi:hypothetical protein